MSHVKHGKKINKNKLQHRGSDAEKRAREEREMVLGERKEREESGSVEGTAHMLSHCF